MPVGLKQKDNVDAVVQKVSMLCVCSEFTYGGEEIRPL